MWSLNIVNGDGYPWVAYVHTYRLCVCVCVGGVVWLGHGGVSERKKRYGWACVLIIAFLICV